MELFIYGVHQLLIRHEIVILNVAILKYSLQESRETILHQAYQLIVAIQ